MDLIAMFWLLVEEWVLPTPNNGSCSPRVDGGHRPLHSYHVSDEAYVYPCSGSSLGCVLLRSFTGVLVVLDGDTVRGLCLLNVPNLRLRGDTSVWCVLQFSVLSVWSASMFAERDESPISSDF